MYNKICATIILHIILLILGEILSKRNNFTSLLLVEDFAEIADVNTKALNIRPVSFDKNIAEEKPRQNVCSYSYLGILFDAAKNAEIRGPDSQVQSLYLAFIYTLFLKESFVKNF